MFCNKCGTKNNDNSDFCLNCGSKLRKRVVEQNDNRVVSEEERNKIKKEVQDQINKKNAASTIGTAATTVGTVAGVATVTAGTSIVKKTIKWGVILSILVAALAFASQLYVDKVSSSPTKVVNKFINSIDKQDYNGMISCLDPSTQKKWEIMSQATGTLLTGLTGVAIDVPALLEAESAFSDLLADPNNACHASNIKTVKYISKNYQGIVDQFGNKFEAVSIILSDEAIVRFEVDNKPSCLMEGVKPSENAKKLIYEFKVKKYGKQWLIPFDTTATFIDSK